jgi:hypothetical protein
VQTAKQKLDGASGEVVGIPFGASMNTMQASSGLVTDLMKALGIPPTAKSFTLRAAVNQAITVECEYYPLVDGHPMANHGELVTAWAEYEVVHRKPLPATLLSHARTFPSFDDWMRDRTNTAHAQYMARLHQLSKAGK